jgi:hypothetical protein
MRRLFHVLLLAAVALITAGVLTEALGLLGIGAWVLIAAGLLEMIYRP